MSRSRTQSRTNSLAAQSIDIAAAQWHAVTIAPNRSLAHAALASIQAVRRLSGMKALANFAALPCPLALRASM